VNEYRPVPLRVRAAEDRGDARALARRYPADAPVPDLERKSLDEILIVRWDPGVRFRVVALVIVALVLAPAASARPAWGSSGRSTASRA